MQDIENDMDDLFKRAGEEYPLKPGRDDWDKILPHLDQRVKRRRPAMAIFSIAAFILLLVGTGIGVSLYRIYEQGNSNKLAGTSQSAKVNVKLNNKRLESNDISKPDGSAKASNNSSPLIGSSIKKTANTTSIILLNQPTGNDRFNVGFNSNKVNNETKELTPGKTMSAGLQNVLEKRVVKKEGSRFIENNGAIISELSETIAEKLDTETFLLPLNSSLKISQKNKLLSINNNVDKQIQTRLKGRFYLQPVASINISNVKNSGNNKVGEDVGLLAGYRINRKLSIETGAIISKKVVNVSGDNFSVDKIGAMLLNGMKMMDVQCKANLIEIPILVRYDLFQKNGTKVFTKAGVSTFVLTQENNSYHTFYNGAEQTLYGKYNDNKWYPAAVINLSAGFETKLTKSASVLVEPYLQLPTTNIGVGSLPITTGGVRFGVKFPLL